MGQGVEFSYWRAAAAADNERSCWRLILQLLPCDHAINDCPVVFVEYVHNFNSGQRTAWQQHQESHVTHHASNISRQTSYITHHTRAPVLGDSTLDVCGLSNVSCRLSALLLTLNAMLDPGAPSTAACARLRLQPSIDSPSISRRRSLARRLPPVAARSRAAGLRLDDLPAGPAADTSAT